MPFRSAAIALPLAALLLAALSPRAGGERVTTFSVPPGTEFTANILFETTFPLNDLLPAGWTPAQHKEVAYAIERMKKDDRVFLLVQTTVDPIGSRAENESWALEVSHAVAGRLRDSGIRGDRIVVVPGGEDARLFDEPRWDGFPRRQTVSVKGMRGGDWLKRREIRVAVREEIPPAGSLRIETPAEGTTDRAQHVLRGAADESVRTVSIVIGRETRTAAVYSGTFEVPISLRPGGNRIVVTGLDRYGRAVRGTRDVLYVPPKPTIEVTSPGRGTVADITRNPVVTVRGVVRSRNPLAQISLIQNDTPRRIRIRGDGSFEQRAVLVTEEDVFTVEAVDAEGQAGVSESRTVGARGIAERPLMAILQWDQDDVDLDLHVTDVPGRHTWFDAPDVLRSATAIPSGKLWLDNREGFGPEVFTIEKEAVGTFTLSAEYYRGRKPCKAYLTIVLYAGSPSQRMVRVFGPIAMGGVAPGIPLVKVSLPGGTIQDLTHHVNRGDR